MTRYHLSGRHWRSYGIAPLPWVLMGLILVGCQGIETSPVPPETPPSQGANSPCPVAYDPDQDYFPDKVQLDYAVGFAVEYHNHYKVVTVKPPWQGADQAFEYVLVQCGAPIPSGYDQAQIIEVPIETVVALSTTYLPHLELLDQVDALVGVDQFQRVNTPRVRDQIDRGELVEFSSGTTLDIERLLVADPDLVMTFSTGNPDTDSYPRLIQAGLPVALVAEYLEETPLGQAEWLKFTALFFNQKPGPKRCFATWPKPMPNCSKWRKPPPNAPRCSPALAITAPGMCRGAKALWPNCWPMLGPITSGLTPTPPAACLSISKQSTTGLPRPMSGLTSTNPG
jgi:ABC-type Fe3+-hydroxamate transport system substrate-binding protein